jgi:hypothetical protein
MFWDAACAFKVFQKIKEKSASHFKIKGFFYN